MHPCSHAVVVDFLDSIDDGVHNSGLCPFMSPYTGEVGAKIAAACGRGWPSRCRSRPRVAAVRLLGEDQNSRCSSRAGTRPRSRRVRTQIVAPRRRLEGV